MTFQNPVVAGEQLVRSAIRSQNYVAGSAGWRIAEDGSAEFQNISVNGYAQGPSATYDAITANNSFTYKGDELQALLDPLSHGTVASAALGNISVSGITTRIGIGEISFINRAGRNYKVIFNGLHTSSQTSINVIQITMLVTTDGSSPNISTSLIADSQIIPHVNLNQVVTTPPMIVNGQWSPTDGARVRIVICIERLAGTGTVSYSDYYNTPNAKPLRLTVEDTGLDLPDTWVSNTAGGVIGGGTPPPAPAPKTTYTSTWYSTAVLSYQSNGNVSTATNHDVYGYQGDGTAVGNPGGNSASLFLFDSAAIQAALSGATILHTYTFTKNVHSYYNSGATARIGTHNGDTLPSTISGVGIHQRRWNQTTPEGGSVWSADTGVTLGQEFQNGTTHGLMLGYSSPASLADYSYWSQLGVRITYQK